MFDASVKRSQYFFVIVLKWKRFFLSDNENIFIFCIFQKIIFING